MPTVESLEIAYQDAISAGANASADSLNKLADAQDRVAGTTDKQDDAIRRATPSAAQLANRTDAMTVASNAAALASANLAAAQDKFAVATAAGGQSATTAAASLAVLQARADAANATLERVTKAIAGGATPVEALAIANKKVGTTAEGASHATAGMTRELIVLGHEALIGNYNRIPGSLLVLMERMGNLGGILSSVTKLFTTFGGAAILGSVGAVAAFVGIGVEAAVTASKLASLQDELSATRDNARGWAADVTAAAKTVSSTTSAAAADTLKAAQTIASNPLFTGTREQLAALTNTAFGLSQVLGISIPDAAKKMSEGLSDPAKIATQLATSIDPLKTIDSVTLGLIIHMQAVGDKIGAAALLNQKFAETAKAAADNVTPLGKAWRDFMNALTGGDTGGNSVISQIGTLFINMTTSVLDAIAKMIKGIHDFQDWLDKFHPSTAAPTDPAGMWLDGQFVPNSRLPSGINGNLDPAAGVAINPVSGARGMMQILPSTAALTPNINPDVLLGNIELGVIDLQRKLSAIGASPTGVGVTQDQIDLAIKHYGENTPEYLAGVKSQNISKLDPSITGAITQVAVERGVADQRLVTALEQIALQENRGQMGPLPGQPGILPNGTMFGMARTGTQQFGPGAPTATQTAFNNAQAGQNARSSADAIAGAIAGPDILKQQKDILELEATIRKLQAAEDDLQKQPGVLTKEQQDLVTGYNTAIAQTKVKLLDVIDPTRQATQATEDQARVDSVVGEADAKLLAIKLQIQRQRENNPAAPESEAAAAAQLAAAVDLQTAGYTKLAAQSQTTIKNNNDLAEAWKSGASAAQDAQSAADAYSTAIKLFSTDDAPTFQKHLADIKTLQDGIRDSSLNAKAAQQGSDIQHQIDMVKAETDTLGENANERAQYLAHLQAEYDLRIKFPGDAMAPIRASLLAENDALVANRQVLADQQSALSELSNAFTQSFDTISQAMVNSFLTGQGAAVNWGNVMKSVVQQVIAEFLKLAILNPLLNSLFNTNNVTLGSVGGLLGLGGEGGMLGAIGGFGAVANDNVDILGNTIGGATGSSGGGGGSILSLLGLGNSVAGANGFGLGSLTGGIKSLLATQIGPGTIQPGIAGAVGDLAPGATLGGLLGGVGLGFGAGSLAGNFIQSSAGKVGPAPTIGAGLGAVGGALAGTFIFPGVGTVLGGLLGGLIGGGGGGLIGPKAPSAFSSTGLNISGGLLRTGASSEQGDASTLAATTAAVNELNTVLQANNVTIQSLGKITQIGQNTKGGFQDPSKAAQVSDAFPSFRFSSSDPHLNAFLQGAGFGSPQELASTVASVQAFVSAVSGTDFAPQIDSVLDSMKGIGNAGTPAALASIQKFVTETVPGLLSAGTNTGSLAQAMNALNAQFAPAIAQAHTLGYKEQELTAARDKAADDLIQQMRDAAEAQRQGNQTQFQAAQATLTGDPYAQYGATVSAFDQQAAAQRKSLIDQYKGIFGDAYAAASEFQMNSVQLEQTLGAQRLVVQKQFNDQMIAAAQAAARANQSVIARQYNAQVALGTLGSPSAALYSFDVQAQAQREDLARSLTTTFGAAFAASKSYADQVAQLDKTLGLERLVIQKQADDALLQQQQAAEAAALQAQQAFLAAQAAATAAAQQESRSYQSIAARQFNAEVTLGTRDPLSAALYAFDVQAQHEREDFSKSLTDAYGAAFAATELYAGNMAQLEKTLGLERLVVQKQANDALIQQQKADQQAAVSRASSDVTNLQTYANSLQTGTNSPLSAQAQYSLASKQFNAVSGAAKAGDITSIEQLSQYSDQLLSASRNVFGSGAGYAADFQRVLASLSTVVSKPAEALTQSAFIATTQDQTTTLANQLIAINTTLGQIKLQLTQTNTKPARAA